MYLSSLLYWVQFVKDNLKLIENLEVNNEKQIASRRYDKT